MTRLEEIVATTRRGLPALHERRAAVERAAAERPPAPSFAAALRGGPVALIAEVKRRSPSVGAIRLDLDPVARAASYVAHGARAISVLTDGPYFGGSLDDLRAVAAAVRAPVLRKDFIVDELQLVEARAAGAAAALLIVRALAPARLQALLAEARGLGLDALVEVHDAPELEVALAAGAEIVGVNSRNLDTFAIDRGAAWPLLQRIPAGRIAVAESGLASVADVTEAARHGADAVLVGTALSAAEAPAALVAGIAGVSRAGRARSG